MSSVVSYVVRDVNKIDFRRFTNETPSKAVDIKSCSDTESCFLAGRICFPPTVVYSVKENYQSCEINSIILSKGQ
jgi:hypothetical protein